MIVNIDDRLYEALRKEAEARGMTVDQLVEEIIRQWLGVSDEEITKHLRRWGYA